MFKWIFFLLVSCFWHLFSYLRERECIYNIYFKARCQANAKCSDRTMSGIIESGQSRSIYDICNHLAYANPSWKAKQIDLCEAKVKDTAWNTADISSSWLKYTLLFANIWPVEWQLSQQLNDLRIIFLFCQMLGKFYELICIPT